MVCHAQRVSMLPDGTFDVIVIDASADDDGTACALELALVTGDHKGDVVTLRMTGERDPVELIGLPATLTVTAGQPSLRIDA